MTLQELKQMVEVPDSRAGIPSAKRVAASAAVVAEKELGRDAKIAVYGNGFAVYRTRHGATVFPIHLCGEYRYGQDKDSPVIGKEFFEGEEWYLRLVLEGEDRLGRNNEAKERRKTVSYSAVSEDWGMMPPVRDSALDGIVWKETLDELLAVLTDRQGKVVRLYFLGRRTQTEIAEELGITVVAVSRMLKRAMGRMRNVPSSAE